MPTEDARQRLQERIDEGKTGVIPDRIQSHNDFEVSCPQSFTLSVSPVRTEEGRTV
jgi:hypothetical protein